MNNCLDNTIFSVSQTPLIIDQILVKHEYTMNSQGQKPLHDKLLSSYELMSKQESLNSVIVVFVWRTLTYCL